MADAKQARDTTWNRIKLNLKRNKNMTFIMCSYVYLEMNQQN